ncbi:hypothetical protein FPOAC2_05894 [Fusarium poae]|uniref:hypothetical protein n=1 Tax=Fusarium poae TaxID=36050 RepID=UPI001CE9078D|nr:hypothetical protein FPOAC1_005777 [Fusarium poae]KAG8672501.1 hypothetical protein FPOAC1_005777 [Fusarium poae]
MYSDQKNPQQRSLVAPALLYGDNHLHQQPPPTYEEHDTMSHISQQTTSSSRPIVLPSSSIGGGLEATPPFIRAYPPVLDSYGISSSEFMAIVDALNIALAEPAPLKAIQIAGNGLGFVPDPVCQGVSLGLGLAAGTATAATAYIRPKRVLERVNRETFAPKGLKIEIVKDEEVMRRLKATARSLEPLQRLQEIAHRVEALSFDVEPPVKCNNVIDRVSAKQAAMKQAKKEERKQKKADKRNHKREKAAEKYNYPIESIEERYDSDTEIRIENEAKIVGLEDKIAEINAKADAKLQVASDKKVREIEKRRAKDLKEVEKDRVRLLEKQYKAIAKSQKKSGEREGKDEKKVAKLEWLMILAL